MKTQFTLEEFLDVIEAHLRTTLERDFPEGGHIVDLLSHATTKLDSVFYWMADYPRESK